MRMQKTRLVHSALKQEDALKAAIQIGQPIPELGLLMQMQTQRTTATLWLAMQQAQIYTHIRLVLHR